MGVIHMIFIHAIVVPIRMRMRLVLVRGFPKVYQEGFAHLLYRMQIHVIIVIQMVLYHAGNQLRATVQILVIQRIQIYRIAVNLKI